MKLLPRYTRRRFIGLLAAAGAASLMKPIFGTALSNAYITRTIPSSGEAIPVIGLGTWITFNVGDDPVARESRIEVMRHFFRAGGRLRSTAPTGRSSCSNSLSLTLPSLSPSPPPHGSTMCARTWEP